MSVTEARIVARRELRGDAPIAIDVTLDDAALIQLARDLGIRAVRKARLKGALQPEGRASWKVEARLGATVVQACVVTLEDVTTRIEEDVTRRYSPHVTDPEEEEVELEAGVDPDPLGDGIDLGNVIYEALSLALPAYPRKDTASLGEAVFTEPGKQAMRDEDTRPFAALQALRDDMADDDDES